MAAIEGRAQSVKAQQEGPDFVLRFVVEREAARFMPVEMRGLILVGVLNDGDHVQFDAEIDEYGIARPRQVSNLTNGSTVLLVEPDLPRRVRRFGGTIAVPVVSSVLSGLLVFALTLPFTSDPVDEPPRPTASPTTEPGPGGLPTTTSAGESTTSAANSTTSTAPPVNSRPGYLPISILLASGTAVIVFLAVRAWQLK
jgi:hypothetical protein